MQTKRRAVDGSLTRIKPYVDGILLVFGSPGEFYCL